MRMVNTIAAAALAAGMAAGPALAQQQGGLVNVNVSDNTILEEIAAAINVDVSQIAVPIQAPIGVAANVCDIDAAVLAQQANQGGATCEAKNTSQAFNQIVQRQVGDRGGADASTGPGQGQGQGRANAPGQNR